jgi:hypothetical protein
MKKTVAPSTLPPATDAGRRRLLQAMGAVSVGALPAWASAQATAKVNTTKLAITDTEVTVGQLHSATGTMAISEPARSRPNSWPSTRSTPWAASWVARSR